jgi:hypothetical protein
LQGDGDLVTISPQIALKTTEITASKPLAPSFRTLDNTRLSQWNLTHDQPANLLLKAAVCTHTEHAQLPVQRQNLSNI